MSVISINKLTKDYGNDRGIFDVTINVEKGECFGFLGPNGAGKTTTIRHLMGFSKPQSGTAEIEGMDTWTNAALLKAKIGYLPGEIAFPEAMTGKAFLKMIGNMRNIENMEYTRYLSSFFELDSDLVIKNMSLGMKRKLAVVTAFMHNPQILILDEPTSGLDPISQKKFIDFILEEKKKGKTIFLSSHIFHEVDSACDRIAIIKDGKIVSEFKAEELKANSANIYRISFGNIADFERFTAMKFNITKANEKTMRTDIMLSNDEINILVGAISDLNVTDIYEMPFTLEDFFMQFYKGGKEFEEVR